MKTARGVKARAGWTPATSAKIRLELGWLSSGLQNQSPQVRSLPGVHMVPWVSGLNHLPAKKAYRETGTAGSNPAFSA